MQNKDNLCHCGEELHYNSPKEKELEPIVLGIIAEMGRYMKITVGGHTWRVDRHYAALHGVKGKDLATLGFEEVEPDIKKAPKKRNKPINKRTMW